MSVSVRFLGTSRVFRAALVRAEVAAASSVPLLLGGESGTGKEVLARHVHTLSPRRAGPFVPVNVAAIPATLLESELFGHERGAFTGADRARPGLFQEARGGTLLIDEIGDLPEQLQVKLLRVLQDGEVRPVGRDRPLAVDVRVIAATHRDLHELVQVGRFREDLFYRVAVFTVELPPLRERGRDVLLLAQHFLAVHAEAEGRVGPDLSPAAAESLLAHDWPGNVRELENACRHALVLCGSLHEVLPSHLPARVLLQRDVGAPPASTSLSAARSTAERNAIVAALLATDGNRTLAARRLGLSRQSLHERLRRHDIGAGTGRETSLGGGPDAGVAFGGGS